MRLDKYLKVSRLIKRRTIANEACDSERVTVNGREAKASYQVKIGDVIEIAFGNRSLRMQKRPMQRPCTGNYKKSPAPEGAGGSFVGVRKNQMIYFFSCSGTVSGSEVMERTKLICSFSENFSSQLIKVMSDSGSLSLTSL